MLEKIENGDKKSTARLTNAYDTLKMLYFKDFKEYSEDSCYSPYHSPSFEKMAEALAPKNFNYASWECGKYNSHYIVSLRDYHDRFLEGSVVTLYMYVTRKLS